MKTNKGKSLLRPFRLFCGLKTRGYSIPLQRRIVDFTADDSFNETNTKLKEHYGIEVPLSSARRITYNHSKIMKRNKESAFLNPQKIDKESSKKTIISETDGCMLPIVITQSKAEASESSALATLINSNLPKQDRRKHKTLVYQEARLTLAREIKSVKPKFGATMESVGVVGQHMKECVYRWGFGEETHVHAVGDGAVWICDQVEEQFGSQATYLVDFYHLCEYLAAAAEKISPGNKKPLMDRLKTLLKENKANQVLQELRPLVEEVGTPENEAPIRACYRYITNRLYQLNYKSAIANELPIGSGEIESSHKYVIQKRLKISGAWWIDVNAEVMLHLRTTRANDDWGDYWRNAA